MKRILLHAPGIHTQGGLVLLKNLISEKYKGRIWINIDKRANIRIKNCKEVEFDTINNSILGRIKAEINLRITSRKNDIILCFHGLPPLLPVLGKVVIFVQNRHHLETNTLEDFSAKTRIRLIFERLLCRLLRKRVHEYVVQTKSMEIALNKWHGGLPVVRVLPLSKLHEEEPVSMTLKDTFDFVYVADGEAHKNHLNLVFAWVELSQENIFPSLCLTVPKRNKKTLEQIEANIEKYKLKIRNIGEIPHNEIWSLYRSSKALIFPSTMESFGLPLLEASHAGLPILASEKDFVRDICTPVETFDPQTPLSISHAVKRFLKIKTQSIQICSPSKFFEEIST